VDFVLQTSVAQLINFIFQLLKNKIKVIVAQYFKYFTSWSSSISWTIENLGLGLLFLSFFSTDLAPFLNVDSSFSSLSGSPPIHPRQLAASQKHF